MCNALYSVQRCQPACVMCTQEDDSENTNTQNRQKHLFSSVLVICHSNIHLTEVGVMHDVPVLQQYDWLYRGTVVIKIANNL